MEYTNTELRILWYLKRHGGVITAKTDSPYESLGGLLASELRVSPGHLRYALRHLEANCVILKTYKRPIKQDFAGNAGFNPILKIELVDPNLKLPTEPPPLPLAVVVAHENQDLYERTAVTPSPEAILEALLNRIGELQTQVDKLQDIVAQQADLLAKADKHTRASVDHLTSRIQGALTAEQWDALTHGSQK